MSVELGRLVQQRRHELGLSRRDLAERSEISYPYISQIETGDRDPSLKTMSRLSEALEVSVQDLASLVSTTDWIGSAPAPVAGAIAHPPSASLPRSYDDDVSMYRAKVMPSVQRRLQSVPPVVRLQLLAELTAEAAREAGQERT